MLYCNTKEKFVFAFVDSLPMLKLAFEARPVLALSPSGFGHQVEQRDGGGHRVDEDFRVLRADSGDVPCHLAEGKMMIPTCFFPCLGSEFLNPKGQLISIVRT